VVLLFEKEEFYMEDEKVVPTGESSKEGEASKEVKPPEAEPQPQPSAEELIKKAIAEQTELAKREIQSVKDKARQEIEDAQAKAGFAEDALANLGKDVDPDAAELAKLRARETYHRKMGAVAQQRQQAEAFDKSFQDSINQYITQIGVDPNDKRIDWAPDDRSYVNRQRRILTSLGSIQQENLTKAQKVLEDNVTQQIKDAEVRIRKDAGLDTEETGVSPGVGGTDADFLDKFGKGELPLSKENVDRANKIMNK